MPFDKALQRKLSNIGKESTAAMRRISKEREVEGNPRIFPQLLAIKKKLERFHGQMQDAREAGDPEGARKAVVRVGRAIQEAAELEMKAVEAYWKEIKANRKRA
ncbi:hypothetical protein N0V90_003568 [Kalmusia sp. IMI 367209]|nr:hypothetical protein N0V90_003568 [Kalmusia sp. IMI 367209]